MSLSDLGIIELAALLAVESTTKYTGSIDFRGCAGDAAVLLISTAGTLAVTQQCSLDDTTWYDPVNSSNAAIGSVASAFTTSTGKYISYTVVLAPYIRFKIVESTAATSVTLKLIYRKER